MHASPTATPKIQDFADVFEEDRELLFNDLRKLPQQSATRKIGELTKRIKTVKAYSLLVNHLLNALPKLCKFAPFTLLKYHREFRDAQKGHQL